MSSFPGAGKSYHAKLIAKEVGAEIVSADDFFIENGIYKFDLAKIGDAHKQCFRKACDAVIHFGKSIVVDNTNLSAWEISPYVALAGAWGFDHEIIRVSCDPAIAFARQTHNVPKKNHDNMVRSFLRKDVRKIWNVKEIKN